MATKKLQDLTASTSPGDADILLIEDTAATKKITFLNLFNRIKTKLSLATVATSGKLADTVKDANNRTITDAERTKWNGYGTSIDSLNSNYQNLNNYTEFATAEYKVTRLGYQKQFIYNGRIPSAWNAGIRFAMNTAAFAAEYRPKATFGTASIITGTGVVATLDFTDDGFIYIKPSAAIAANSWVTIHVCYI